MPVSVDLTKIKIVKLSEIYDLKRFGCGDHDINDFIRNDAFEYEKQRLARTYLVIYNEQDLVGFFSLVNDAIRLKEDEKEDDGLPFKLHEFPATKIVRMAVHKPMQSKGIGSIMVRIAFGFVLNCDHGVSRFVTVDSYPSNISFYERFNFVKNLHSNYTKKDDFVSMRYDLLNPSPEQTLTKV